MDVREWGSGCLYMNTTRMKLARISVVRRATGLTLSEVEEQRRASQDWALAAPQEPRKPSERGLASCQRVEWARVERLRTEQRMAVYSPDEDPQVARREERRAQRKATGAAWSEQSGGGLPVEVLRHRVYRIAARPAPAPVGEEALVRTRLRSRAWRAVEHARPCSAGPAASSRTARTRFFPSSRCFPNWGIF